MTVASCVFNTSETGKKTNQGRAEGFQLKSRRDSTMYLRNEGVDELSGGYTLG